MVNKSSIKNLPHLIEMDFEDGEERGCLRVVGGIKLAVDLLFSFKGLPEARFEFGFRYEENNCLDRKINVYFEIGNVRLNDRVKCLRSYLYKGRLLLAFHLFLTSNAIGLLCNLKGSSDAR